ncbi:hypothetical protein GMAR_ORF172 [Golden Marseillevirus]|uniref:hypothetical protein n=1 Tax=Golden Marseillevirus TaxID=1720526 RepID=UPI000877A9A9|nr:hypothetical protein GMAR_ORF172 [Golden Marseillevirus]ALX27546.1 hypothetical protein GMAR_ORF172 [Golden Marseillevirus]
MMKISQDGIYQPFYGVTVLSKNLDKETFLIEEEIWKSSLSSAFSPLPFESYHMTVFDLVVPENSQTKEKFGNFLSQNRVLLNKIAQECQKEREFVARLKRIYWTKGTLGIELEPCFDRRIRERISKRAGIKDNLGYTFHMTLAYRYKDRVLSEQEIESLKKVIRRVFPSGFAKFERPKLHMFESMREFICCE